MELPKGTDYREDDQKWMIAGNASKWRASLQG